MYVTGSVLAAILALKGMRSVDRWLLRENEHRAWKRALGDALGYAAVALWIVFALIGMR